MSNRVISEKRSNYRNSSKPQMKYVPKRDFQNPNSRQSLSNSFRSTTATSSSDMASSSTSRVEIEEKVELKLAKSYVRGSFMIYLPHDEAVASGLGPEDGALDPEDSQRVVDLLNRELLRLLKLHPRDFWREVASDESLHLFLESFLKFKSRWSDFPYRGAQGVVAGVIIGEFDLCRRVFMVLYRLSSNRDPGAKAVDMLSLKDHAALLQDKKLLDLPKLLDICAVYGHENEDVTRILVTNAMKAQPWIHDEFPQLMSHFLSISQTMCKRCNSTLEGLLSSGGEDKGSNRLRLDYLEVMDFINDAVVSMDSFVNAYKHAAIFFSTPAEMSDNNEELLAVLGKLHDSLLPSLLKGFRIFSATLGDAKQDMSSNVLISLKMLSTRITKFGWNLLNFCYLSDEAFKSSHPLPTTKMFPANVEDPVIRADILIQSIRDLSGLYAHSTEGYIWETFLQNIEKNHKIMNRINLLRKTGWMVMDDEQFQFLSGIMTPPVKTTTQEKRSASFPITGKGKQTDEYAAITESKIIQIKELFPDYGNGFLLACLEAYNQDAEEVIQRILEGTLHEELQSLDVSLQNIPPPKATMPPPVGKNDKGKGKLVESVISPLTQPSVNIQRGTSSNSSSSTSSFGRFIRKTDEFCESNILNAKSAKQIAKTEALLSLQDYEDEYDDSFDDLGMSVQDSGLDECETLINTSNGNSSSSSDKSKWGSHKKPQFYVKDGKNYSYKVAGSVAVANINEAKVINQSQKALVHGLGQGGNLPLGAVKKVSESSSSDRVEGDEKNESGGGSRGFSRGGRGGRRGGFNGGRHTEDGRDGSDEVVGRGRGSFRGRGGRGFQSGGPSRVVVTQSNDEQDEEQDVGGKENTRGGGGGRRGRGRNNFQKDRAMNKHFAGMPGHFK